MRELGFRVWDKEDEVYLHITKNKEDGVVGISPDGKKVLYLEDGEVIILEDVIIEQDTGLKDKNGKKIYEGDIIKFDNYGDEEISEVYFNGACAGYCTHIVDDHDGDYLPFTRGRDVEVIGNHENPELVETNK